LSFLFEKLAYKKRETMRGTVTDGLENARETEMYYY
jgi:hypothetical protein